MMSRQQAKRYGCTHVGNMIDCTHTLPHKMIIYSIVGKSFRCHVSSLPVSELRIARQTMIHVKETENYFIIPDTMMKFSKVDGELFNPACCEAFHPIYLDLNSLERL